MLRELRLFSYRKDLRVNGLLFQELSSEVRELYLDTNGIVIEMPFHVNLHGTNNLWAEKRVVIMRTFKLLKCLIIYNFKFLKCLINIPNTNLLQRDSSS